MRIICSKAYLPLLTDVGIIFNQESSFRIIGDKNNSEKSSVSKRIEIMMGRDV